MSIRWADEISNLERRLAEVKEYQRITLEAEEQIKIGVIIVDRDSGKEMKVSKLRNGSNDFEANPVDGKGVGRGYSYLVRNWRLKD